MNTHQMYQEANAKWQPVMNNPAVPFPMLQPTSGQQVPTNHFIAPMQHHMIPKIHNYPNEDYTSQQLQRMTSTARKKKKYKIRAKMNGK
jgi:hypothetical protein